jgi:hypothetical protein
MGIFARSKFSFCRRSDVSGIIYHVMGLYRLSKTVLFWLFCRITSPFFVLHHTFSVLLHPFGIIFILLVVLLNPFGIIFTLLVVLLHPFGIIFTLSVVLLHLFGIIPTLLGVLHHPFTVKSYVTNSVSLTLIAWLLTAANPELI